MKKHWNPDSPVMQALSGFSDLVVVNIIWLLCCIPVITAGASTAALYRVTLNMARNTGGSAAKSFFRAFAQNWKSGTKAFLACLAFLAVAIAGVWILDAIAFRGRQAVVTLLLAWILGFLLLAGYLFPLIAQFENTVSRTFRNAFALSIQHYPVTLAMLMLHLLPVLLYLFAPTVFEYSLFIWLTVGGALIARIDAAMLKRVFDSYMPAIQED